MEKSAAMKTPAETSNNASKDEYDHEYTRLAEKIEHSLNFDRLGYPSPISIYRVPDLLRKWNEEAYTPQVISIGPFHYHSQKLQSMENFKLKFLKTFIGHAKVNLKGLVSTTKPLEQILRKCYAGKIEIDSDDFVKMILVDASFLIEFFLFKYCHRSWADGDGIELKPWLISRMLLDLKLLENQLPFFIIEKLYELRQVQSIPECPSSFLELTVIHFGMHNHQGKLPHQDPDRSQIATHFVDLLRYFYLPPDHQMAPPERSTEVVKEMYCASQLAEAGLKFQLSSSKCSLDLHYNKGVLEIPSFTLDNDTEIYARNIMALEQCHYPDKAYVSDYFIMLDFLTNTGKDVDLLVDEKIIEKGQGTNNRPMFPSNLCTGISYWNIRKDYYALSRQVVEFRRKHWYVILKGSFKHDYFRTPWMGAATIGAIILLILTLIQTVCAVISIL